MPTTIKIRVQKARNLPVMDRVSSLTDAFVSLQLSGKTFETSICRRSLDPVWNEDFRFDILDDAVLQDEPLLLRVMDYDVYSASDLIGSVYISLNPLFLGSNSISGWFPVFDTLRGTRGQLQLVIKAQFTEDANPFRHSSAGVRFLATSQLDGPSLLIESVLGFADELVVDNDPEYEYLDNFRSARKSNESRHQVFYRLSGSVRRQIGKKVCLFVFYVFTSSSLCFNILYL